MSRRKTFTGLVKFAVVAYGRIVVVFAHCEYEAVGIATEDPNLHEYYPRILGGYVYAQNLDEPASCDDTFNGYDCPEDDYDDTIGPQF